MPKIRKATAIIMVNLFVLIGLFLLSEGLASTYLVVREALTSQPLAERSHTEYDPELGWVNTPNVHIPDMYGPGIYFTTNSQSFRNTEDFSLQVPPGVVRIICSGDSFTLGYGVDNEHTWCQLLTAHDDRLQTVNMGQGGYGVDQAYLWYRRDGTRLDHDIHLLALITLDFDRMKSDDFMGYGRPVLEWREGRPVNTNTPVPRRAFYVPFLSRTLPLILRFDSARLATKALRKLTGDRGAAGREDAEIRAVVDGIFAELLRLNREKNSIPVLVYLPTLEDYMAEPAVEWRRFVRDEAHEKGIFFIDLIAELRKLPPHEVTNKFIPFGEVDFQGAAGHYSAEGNAYIAGVLTEKLLGIPEVSDRLAAANR